DSLVHSSAVVPKVRRRPGHATRFPGFRCCPRSGHFVTRARRLRTADGLFCSAMARDRGRAEPVLARDWAGGWTAGPAFHPGRGCRAGLLAVPSGVCSRGVFTDAPLARGELKGAMKISTLTVLLQVAAVLHLGLLAAGGTMPKAVRLREHTA